MKFCCIFCAMPTKADNVVIPKNSFIIAADGGFETTQRLDITPDAVIGDFDSLGFIPKSDRVAVFPVEKDDTDSMLAIKKGIEMGCDFFLIYGALGGRLDHTLANIQALEYLTKHGKTGILVGDTQAITVFKNSTLIVDGVYGDDISVFSLSEKSLGVSISGTKYTLENSFLERSFPLGVSNKFEKAAQISVKNGTLCVIWTFKRFTPDSMKFLSEE